jgi:gliding motility-associated-like protein
MSIKSASHFGLIYYRHILQCLILCCSINSLNAQCAGTIDFTLSPPPSAANTYPAGATVQLCVTMVGWPGTSTGANWLEGFGLNLGSGWVTVTPVTYPEDCGGASPPNAWLFVNSTTSSATGNTAGPGFFYEGPAGPTDGDPGNDFGDSGGMECTWGFCVDLTADNSPGVDLSLSVSVYSDGDMGSWGNTDCVGADPPEEITPGGTITENCTVLGCVDANACNFNAAANCDDGSCIDATCNDAAACNYDPTAPCFDNTLCIPAGCIDPAACNLDVNAGCDDGSCVYPGCIDNTACNFDPAAGCDNGTCTYPGCTDAIACNFDLMAGCDNGSCVFPGCDDNTACNFDVAAGCSDGSCTYPGCTDNAACNYQPASGCDDGSCTFPGCTAPLACNYAADAGCDDGSCFYMNTGIITHDAMPCPDVVCIGYQETYATTGYSNSNYQWELINGGGTIVDNNGPTCDIIWGNTPGTYSLTVQEITPQGCMGDLQTCQVEVIIPQIDFDTNYHIICLNASVPLVAEPAGGSWESDFMQGSTFTGTTAGNHRAYYSAIIEDCLTEDYVTVVVKPMMAAPQIALGDTLIDLCREANLQFYAVDTIADLTYEWRIDNSLYEDLSPQLEIFWDDSTRNYLMSVTASDTLGCKSEPREFYVSILNCELFYAPNAFTPDNDGINDRFFASDIGMYEEKLSIYNRWGDLIYQTDNLTNGWSGDDGTGYYAPNGIYFWKLSYKNATGQHQEKEGFVLMSR